MWRLCCGDLYAPRRGEVDLLSRPRCCCCCRRCCCRCRCRCRGCNCGCGCGCGCGHCCCSARRLSSSARSLGDGPRGGGGLRQAAAASAAAELLLLLLLLLLLPPPVALDLAVIIVCCHCRCSRASCWRSACNGLEPGCGSSSSDGLLMSRATTRPSAAVSRPDFAPVRAGVSAAASTPAVEPETSACLESV